MQVTTAPMSVACVTLRNRERKGETMPKNKPVPNDPRLVAKQLERETKDAAKKAGLPDVKVNRSATRKLAEDISKRSSK